MIWHPATLCMISLNAAVLILLSATIPTLLEVIQHWDPDSAKARQLHLEAKIEWAGFLGALAFVLYLLGFLVKIGSIATLFPTLVSGAMCGTGVMQAMSPFAQQGLFLDSMCLLVFFSFFRVYQLNTTYKRGRYQVLLSRILLLVVPLALVSNLFLVKSFLRLNPTASVQCCAAVYHVLEQGPAVLNIPLGTLISSGWVVFFSNLFFLVLPVLSHKNHPLLHTIGLAVALLSTSTWILLKILPYHYGLLDHHCFWCSLRWTYYGVGYLWIVCLIMLVGLYVDHLIRKSLFPERQWTRTRWLLLNLMVYAIFFSSAMFPVVQWMIRTGSQIQ